MKPKKKLTLWAVVQITTGKILGVSFRRKDAKQECIYYNGWGKGYTVKKLIAEFVC